VIIAVEGSIGSGKSTTASLLARELSYGVLLEQTERHPFLADFYADPERNALQTELAFLVIHYHQLVSRRETGQLVMDFSPGKDLVFGRLNLHDGDLRLFEQVSQNLYKRIRMPDLAIFLDLPLRTLQHRIRQRGRPYEQRIPDSYLERLRESYLANFGLLAAAVEVLSVGADDSADVVADRALALVTRHLKSRS